MNSLLAYKSREAQCGVTVARPGDVERGRAARFAENVRAMCTTFVILEMRVDSRVKRKPKVKQSELGGQRSLPRAVIRLPYGSGSTGREF